MDRQATSVVPRLPEAMSAANGLGQRPHAPATSMRSAR
jgi:hypothetical protein